MACSHVGPTHHRAEREGEGGREGGRCSKGIFVDKKITKLTGEPKSINMYKMIIL